MRRASLLLLVPLVAALAASCGGTDSTTPADDRAPSTTPRAVELRRTGGLAGVDDTLRLSADGRASLTRRDGASTDCRVDRAVTERLWSVDLAALGPPPSGGPRVADGFVYRVRSGGHDVTVADGETGGRRAELVDAAAAVFAACQA